MHRSKFRCPGVTVVTVGFGCAGDGSGDTIRLKAVEIPMSGRGGGGDGGLMAVVTARFATSMAPRYATSAAPRFAKSAAPR